MTIDILRLIEDALIGGRNGEMAYIYNNPLIEQIYRDWRNNNLQVDNTFKAFLIECLNTKQNKSLIDKQIGYKILTKAYQITKSDSDWKEYERLGSEIRKLTDEKNQILKNIAESKNKMLADISKYEIKYNDYSTNIVFSVRAEEVIRED